MSCTYHAYKDNNICGSSDITKHCVVCYKDMCRIHCFISKRGDGGEFVCGDCCRAPYIRLKELALLKLSKMI